MSLKFSQKSQKTKIIKAKLKMFMSVGSNSENNESWGKTKVYNKKKQNKTVCILPWETYPWFRVPYILGFGLNIAEYEKCYEFLFKRL